MKRENYILVLIVAIVLLYSAILPAQTITILSPNGGENWKAGSQHEIKWTSSGFSGPVQISVSYDGWAAKFWLIVEHSTANDGSYMWTPTYSYKSSTCVIRIQDEADGDPYDLSNALFTISSPEGTFNFDDGTDQNWTVAGPYGDQGGGPVSSHFFSLWKDDVNYDNPPGKDPTNNDGSFSLGTLNGHGITGGLTGTFWIMQLKSPDLTSNATWQAANGFTVRIADCMGWSNIYANLYVTVYDKSQSKERTFYSGTAQTLSYDTYGDWDAGWNLLDFDWSSIPSFPSNYEVKRVMVYIWGHLAGYYEGGVYLDEVVPTFSSGSNTSTGTNVSVNAGSGVEVTFDNVTGAGNTTVTTKSSGTPPPGGFQVVPSSSPIYYDVETTATFSGNVEICIQYNDAGMTPAQEAALKLQVYENPPGAWKDITSSLDTGTNIICGTVNHLSEFAVMFSSDAPDIAVNSNAIGDSVAVGASTVESFTISNSGNADLTFDISGAKWEKMPGSARDIGVGDDGEAWVIGTTKITYGYDIYRWTGTEWNGIPGAAMTIDVGSQNQIVVVNDADDIFQWDGSNWQPLPGKARQVSIASDGTMWAIGKNAVFGGFEILKWNGLGWDLMPGGAVKIGVGSKNHIWCVSDLNLIYRWNGSDWDLIPGVGSDISVGSDGEVWVVSSITTTGGNEIFRWNGTDWGKQPAGAVAIGVGSASHIWDVNDLGEIYHWNSSALALPAWLNVSQLTGTVTPGGQQDIKVTLDAASLTPDTYFTDLFINSNDPDEPVVQIPVTLEVLPITDVEETHSANTPDRFYLFQNYPNPFNPETYISFELPNAQRSQTHVDLFIYNMQGQLVRQLVNENKSPGAYSIKWDAKNDFGEKVPSGIYVYTLSTGKFKLSRKMLLLK